MCFALWALTLILLTFSNMCKDWINEPDSSFYYMKILESGKALYMENMGGNRKQRIYETRNLLKGKNLNFSYNSYFSDVLLLFYFPVI